MGQSDAVVGAVGIVADYVDTDAIVTLVLDVEKQSGEIRLVSWLTARK